MVSGEAVFLLGNPTYNEKVGNAATATNGFFTTIGPAGAALLVCVLVVSVLLHILLGQSRLRVDGFAVGLVVAVGVVLLMPVHTDSPAPPLTLSVIPMACVLALCTFLPLKRALAHSAVATLFAVCFHQAWMDRVFPGYLGSPKSRAMYARQEEKTATRRFRDYLASEDPAKPLPAGYLDEPPYSDFLGRSVSHLQRTKAVPEWHTSFTGLYKDASTPLRLWTNGGLPAEASVEPKP